MPKAILILFLIILVVVSGCAKKISSEKAVPLNETSPVAENESKETPAPDKTAPLIAIDYPEYGAAIKTESLKIEASTDENSTCQSRLSATARSPLQTDWKQMEATGEKSHAQNFQNLENGNSYKIEIKCSDKKGNEAENSVIFSVKSEYSDYLILENIENFIYNSSSKAIPELSIQDNHGEGFVAKYKPKDNSQNNLNDYNVEVWVYASNNKIKESLEKYMFDRMYVKDNSFFAYLSLSISVSLKAYNSNNSNPVYYLVDGADKEKSFAVWTNENKIIKVQGSPSKIIEAYFKKFPSDFKPTIKCFDTDNGKDYIKKGIAVLIDVRQQEVQEDICSANVLTERFCDGNKLTSETYICPGGKCNPKGACE